MTHFRTTGGMKSLHVDRVAAYGTGMAGRGASPWVSRMFNEGRSIIIPHVGVLTPEKSA